MAVQAASFRGDLWSPVDHHPRLDLKKNRASKTRHQSKNVESPLHNNTNHTDSQIKGQIARLFRPLGKLWKPVRGLVGWHTLCHVARGGGGRCPGSGGRGGSQAVSVEQGMRMVFFFRDCSLFRFAVALSLGVAACPLICQ